jgi:endoglucanase Acf2
MVWSMLAQAQTWFGNEPYKSYGINLMPLTAISELRDTPAWVKEMLPYFQESCSQYPACRSEGWSILIIACLATIGQVDEAFEQVLTLPEEVFNTAGGNGHSRSNTLWYVATRPTPDL